MTRRARLPAALAALLTFGSTTGVAASEPAPLPERQRPAETKTLDRPLDPVVLVAEETLADWLGRPVDRIRAFAFVNGVLRPVPFQIDPVGDDGVPLYELGIRNDRAKIDDVLSPKDELVLVASEAGDRPPATLVVPGALTSRLVTLEAPASDDGPATRGWFLLAYYGDDPPPSTSSPRVLIAQKMKHNLVFSDHYTVRFYDFYPGSHSLVPSDMRIPIEGGGTSVDFLDRFKWRVQFSLLWGLYKVHFDEQMVNVRVVSWSEGPVRIRRFVTMTVRLPLGIEGPTIDIHAELYPRLIQVPLEIDVPTAPKLLSASTEFSLGVDLAPEADGMQFLSPVNPEGFLVDGWMSGPELEHDDERAPWWLWSGEQGTVVQRSHWDAGYRAAVEMRHEYSDDDESASPPEDHPGERGALYERMVVDDIPVGTYRGLLEWWFPGWDAYEPGDERDFLDVYDAPLEVRVDGRTVPAFPLDDALREPADDAPSTDAP